MNTSVILFYVLASLMLFFGLMTVISRKFFRAAVYLLASLLVTSGIYLMLAFNFIAIVQVMVYIGGIVVLILFSILLTQSADQLEEVAPFPKRAGAMVLAMSGFAYTSYLLLTHSFPAQPDVSPDLQLATIGRQLLGTGTNGYILPFELITILLLAAMIGSIVVAFKPKTSSRTAAVLESESE